MKVIAKFLTSKENQARLEKRVTAVKKALPEVIMNYLHKVGKTARNIVKNERYDTGALHNSIKVHPSSKTKLSKLSGMRGTVGPDMREVPYAEFIELGFHANGTWVPPAYYMTRAIKYHKQPLLQESVAYLSDQFIYYGEGGKHLKYPELQDEYFGEKTGKLRVKKLVPRTGKGTRILRKKKR